MLQKSAFKSAECLMLMTQYFLNIFSHHHLKQWHLTFTLLLFIITQIKDINLFETLI